MVQLRCYPNNNKSVLKNGWQKFTDSCNGQEILPVSDISYEIKKDQKYTQQIKIKTDGTINSLIYTFYYNQTHHDVQATIINNNDGTYTAYATYTINQTSNLRCCSIKSISVANGTYVSFKEPKLEKGDYTPYIDNTKEITEKINFVDQKIANLNNRIRPNGYKLDFINSTTYNFTSSTSYDYNNDVQIYNTPYYGMLMKLPWAYKYTTSGSSNMYITGDGLIARVSSARKYKDDIKYLTDINHAKKILNIDPASWYDKAEERRIAEGEEKTLNRYYGFIADDFDEQGLEEVVIRDSEGEVDSLAYDRISIYLLQLIKDLYKENDLLKEEIKQLKEAIK